MIRQERLDELKRCDNPRKFFDEFSCEVNGIVKQHREDFEGKAHSFKEKRLRYVDAIKNLLKERKERKKPSQPLVFEQYRKQLSITKIPERLSILEQCQKQLSNISNPAVVFREIGIIEQCLKWLRGVRESVDISCEVAVLVHCQERLWGVIKKQGWKNITIGIQFQTRRSGTPRSFTHGILVSPDFSDDPALWFEIYDPFKYNPVYNHLSGVATCSPGDELLRGYVALAVSYNKQAKERGESPIAPDILSVVPIPFSKDEGQLFGIEIPDERFFNDSNWLKVRNVLINDLFAVDKDLASGQPLLAIDTPEKLEYGIDQKQVKDKPNTSEKPENPVDDIVQDIALIFPLYPFRQRQKDARNKIMVSRRDKDECWRLWQKGLKEHLTQEEHKLFVQLHNKMPGSERLTNKEIRLIRLTVGSFVMEEIGAYLMQNCNVPQSELNNLSWPAILTQLRVRLRELRRMKKLQADLPSRKQNESQQAEAAEKPAEGAETQALTDAVLYIKKGPVVWEFYWRTGEKASVSAKLRGLKLIECLIQRYNAKDEKAREFWALELLQKAGLRSDGEIESENVIDERTALKVVAEYKRKESEFKDAQNDPLIQAQLKEEMEKLHSYLNKAFKFGVKDLSKINLRTLKTRTRKMLDRNRVAVHRLLNRVFKEIKPQNKELYSHFKAFLRPGVIVGYKPDTETIWTIL